MKLKLSQLRQIIKEEVSHTLTETSLSDKIRKFFGARTAEEQKIAAERHLDWLRLDLASKNNNTAAAMSRNIEKIAKPIDPEIKIIPLLQMEDDAVCPVAIIGPPDSMKKLYSSIKKILNPSVRLKPYWDEDDKQRVLARAAEEAKTKNESVKLKLSQLEQIIKEEVTSAMNEGSEWVVQGPEGFNEETFATRDEAWEFVNDLINQGEAAEDYEVLERPVSRQQVEGGDIKISDSLSQAESKLIAALKPLNAALEIDGFRASELYSKVDDAAATIAFVLEEIEKMKRP